MGLSRSDKLFKIRNGEMMEACGLELYPIKMRHFEIFSSCKEALALRMSSLPVRMMTLDFLSAVFAMEIEALKVGAQNAGLFGRVMQLFYLALRVDIDRNTLAESIQCDANGKLTAIKVWQNGKEHHISPYDFSCVIRPILAEQNGIELPNEQDNIDLVKSNDEKKALTSFAKLKVNTDDLIASVAYQSRMSEREINDMTVREFEYRRKAIERDKRYMLYASAELSGMVKFKDGNPYQSWCFDSYGDELGTMGVAELGKALQGAKPQ